MNIKQALGELKAKVEFGLVYFKERSRHLNQSSEVTSTFQSYCMDCLLKQVNNALKKINDLLNFDLPSSPELLETEQMQYIVKLQRDVDQTLCVMMVELEFSEPIMPSAQEAKRYIDSFKAIFSALFVIEQTVKAAEFKPISPSFRDKDKPMNHTPEVRFIGFFTTEAMMKKLREREYVLINSHLRSHFEKNHEEKTETLVK